MTTPPKVFCANPLCKKGLNRTRKKFVPVREHQRFCSDYCRLKNWNRERSKGVPLTRELVERVKKIESKIGI